MDRISLFNILTVTLPEVILDIYLALVLIGHRNRLYLDDKLNVIRLVSAVVLLATIEVINKLWLPNLMFVILANVLLFSIVFRFVYKLKWSESILCPIIIFGFIFTIEATYVYQFVLLMYKDINEFNASDFAKFICSLPERVLQVAVIVSFWKWDLIYLNLKGQRKILRIFATLAILLFTTEIAFSYMFLINIDMLSTVFKVICSIGSLSFAIINFLLCKFVLLITQRFQLD